MNINVGGTQTTEFSNPPLRQPLGFETTLGSNLLLSLSQIRTFYGEGQGFTAQPWPNPSSHIYTVALRTYIQESNFNLLDTFFTSGFHAAPWTNPRAYIHDISLRTHIQIRNPNLLDIFFGVAGQPLSFEPPGNPALPQYNISLRTHLQDTKLNLISLDTMFAGAGQVPQYDWQLPVLAKFPLDLRGFIQELKQNLLSQDTMLGLPGAPLEAIQFMLASTPTYLQYGIGLLIIEPALVLPIVPVVIATTQSINEFDLGNAIINRALELFRKF